MKNVTPKLLGKAIEQVVREDPYGWVGSIWLRLNGHHYLEVDSEIDLTLVVEKLNEEGDT